MEVSKSKAGKVLSFVLVVLGNMCYALSVKLFLLPANLISCGTTGLAFGDHLHLGILVGGMEVTPLEWIDAKWIRDNITGRLKASGF